MFISGYLTVFVKINSHYPFFVCSGVSNTTAIVKSAVQLELDRAKFLIYQAFEEDENGSKEEAVELYMQTAELCLQIVNNIKLLLYH